MGIINKEQEYQDQEAWSKDIEKLKGYKELKEKVEYWAEQNNDYNVPVIDGPYEIVYDNELGWCVDIDGDVDFHNWNVKEFPFQFRNVSGWFEFSGCKELTSLKGCPIYVGDLFGCNGCKELTSLKGCPVYIGFDFFCSFCPKLTSLEGCPKEVRGDFCCSDCGKKFTKEYIRSLCNVKGDIYNGTNQ